MMKTQFSPKRILAAALAILMVISLLPASALSVEAATKTYVLNFSDMDPFEPGTKYADGDTLACGTDDYFNIYMSAKAKIDSSNKSFADGFSATQRIHYNSSTKIGDTILNAIQFKTSGPATVKIWWVCGDAGREVGIFTADGLNVTQTNAAAAKNDLLISELKLNSAGTYLLGNVGGNNYHFKIEVTEETGSVSAPVEKHFDLNFSDMEPFASGTYANGDTLACGTDDYFNIYMSSKTRVDGSNKSFDDGVSATQRIHYGGNTKIEDTIVNAIQITTTGEATVRIWWVCGDDNREVGIYNPDGSVLTQSSVSGKKNDLNISELKIATPGTYYIGNVGGNNYHFRIHVTELISGDAPKPERKAWADVAAPVITDAADNGEGVIEVKVNAVVGYDGGDELLVTMYDAGGKELTTRRVIAEKSEHTVKFEPADSGKYTFKAVLNREGESGKKTTEGKSANFTYPLGIPNLISATSKGGGKIELEWTAVHEADSYDIYCGEKKVGNSKTTKFTVTGLTVGTRYSFRVMAVRGLELSAASDELSATATKNEQLTWGFSAYGPSTNKDKNGYEGSINEDGKVTVFSEGGKGKLQPQNGDGIAFYYTAVPTEYNFTLRARVTIDSWTYSNGQEGFGLIATDALGVHGDSTTFYNNSYMVGCTKIEYRFIGSEDGGKIYDVNYDGGTKYSMKLGLGILAKTGVTPKNQADFTNSPAFKTYSKMTSLESAAGNWEKDPGSYNIVGNETSGNIANTNLELDMKTTFILEIQKNNTGYFITYYDESGKVLAREKNYDPDALSQLDPDHVYVGFFASRNARATFSDVTMTKILAKDDVPAEEKPVTKIEPTVTTNSGAATTKQDYELLVDTNVDGKLEIQVKYETVFKDVAIKGGKRLSIIIPMKDYGPNDIKVIFNPDPDQDLGPDTELSSASPISASTTVVWNKGNYHVKTIYVSPDVKPEDGIRGNGSRENPYDIYTAVSNVIPGQTIVLMEGTYELITTLRIERGMDGTEKAPIRMIADPEAKTRPVLNFMGLANGIVHGGDYWYFYGFDVTNSAPGQKGFQVSGSFNTLDQINTYHNGNTGIQISRMYGTDLFDYWPAYNLILNCTSYCNCDPGYEDADGFAAKLTCGEGNVFDGCVAYNNADDGYDLYAKNSTGPIGTVTIRNSLAFANGYLEDGTDAGNGNGFKMGGDSLSGYHVLENCIAFYNKAKGIDSNSCPDIQVFNCISYNNGSYNVAFYTNVGGISTDYFATGLVSFRNDKDTVFGAGSFGTGENLKPQGSQDTSKYIGKTNYYWGGGASVNSSGGKITADMFVSLSFNGFTRNPDGTINLGDFLKLNDKAPANVGAKGNGTASSDTVDVLEEDLEHTFGEEWINTDSQLHWHECECGRRGDLAPHDYVEIIDREATPDQNGEKHKECTVCGYKQPSITIYYEEVKPEDPDVPGTTPVPTDPAETPDKEPAGKGDNTVTTIIIIAAVVAVLAVAAIVVILVVLPKMKKKALESDGAEKPTEEN